MTILYATTNPGKFNEAKKNFAEHGIVIVSPLELEINIEVEETGSSLEANARLKAEAYLPYVNKDTIVIGDDTGIFIDALNGEPGIRVRRWKGSHMNDEEIINYCLEKMAQIPHGKRSARFCTVLAVAQTNIPTKFFDGILVGSILTNPLPEREPGMPFWPLFYYDALKMTLGEFHARPMSFQQKYPTHREIAVNKVAAYLSSHPEVHQD